MMILHVTQGRMASTIRLPMRLPASVEEVVPFRYVQRSDGAKLMCFPEKKKFLLPLWPQGERKRPECLIFIFPA
jgi:hypothetical protein